MSFNFILVVLLAAICCLTPFAAYLFWLSGVNRRSKPTVLDGPLDFTALILGLSGFLLFGGGLLLVLLQSNARFLMRGNFAAVRAAWGEDRVTWGIIVILYLLVVVGGVILALRGRKSSLVTYNVEPSVFEGTLAEVFDALGIAVERRGNLWVGGVPLLELEPFAAGHAVVLRWLSPDEHLFQEFDRLLREALAGVDSPENPAARWMMSGAVSSFVIVVFCFLLLIYSLNLIR